MEDFYILLGGALLTLARRYKNSDPNAGLGVAFWIMLIIFFRN